MQIQPFRIQPLDVQVQVLASGGFHYLTVN